MITVAKTSRIIPRIKRFHAFGDKNLVVTSIDLPFLNLMHWGNDASTLLIQTMWGQLKDWPSVRTQWRKGYAKGRAQGLKETRAKVDYWREAYQDRTEELSKAQVELNSLRNAIHALRNLDKHDALKCQSEPSQKEI